ncbi:hypothetical protein [Chitinophaga nivalis]|uniref:Uncharacterized protein n=1 Tax=Chitinophaga nivalis TaxID=2991709 RepID=A0ABT3IL07_9BACT|nr:hypothetical protein [Chitinophaga nivalis]MCW3465658.1 hypothetical protein [Chitinophaga nivalis]MCW3484651.1 hypothetical protein [Chitinophaga nivalis]
MYIPFILFFVFLFWYGMFRFRSFRKGASGKRHHPPANGEDASGVAKITGVANSVFSVSKYLRCIRNTSPERFITVAVDQVITTSMGTSHKSRLFEHLAPGEERRLGHADHVREGKHRIYIGYEILWAQYSATPAWYTRQTNDTTSAAAIYSDMMKHHQSLLQEMEDTQDELW